MYQRRRRAMAQYSSRLRDTCPSSSSSIATPDQHRKIRAETQKSWSLGEVLSLHTEFQKQSHLWRKLTPEAAPRIVINESRSKPFQYSQDPFSLPSPHKQLGGAGTHSMRQMG